MISPGAFARRLERAALAARTELAVPTEAFMAEVEHEAKAAVGTYTYGWPQLAESTQDDRVKLGYSANDPLLRSGALRESIQHKADLAPEGAEGLIYSDEKTALWAELGTARGEPPRSFLFGALWRSTPAMAKIFGAFAESLFAR